MRTALILLLLLGGSTAQAAHIRGHYGGVPAVQPAPLPWHPQPAPPPTYGAPAPPPRVIVVPPQINQAPERPRRHWAPNVCDAGRC